jgi:hypothetical protein
MDVAIAQKKTYAEAPFEKFRGRSTEESTVARILLYENEGFGPVRSFFDWRGLSNAPALIRTEKDRMTDDETFQDLYGGQMSRRIV